MDILSSLFYWILECSIDFVKYILHIGTYWIFEVLNCTFKVGTAFSLSIIERALSILFACLFTILRYIINGLIDLTIDLIIWLVRIGIGIGIPCIRIMLEGLYQAYVMLLDFVLEHEYIFMYEIENDDYDRSYY